MLSNEKPAVRKRHVIITVDSIDWDNIRNLVNHNNNTSVYFYQNLKHLKQKIKKTPRHLKGCSVAIIARHNCDVTEKILDFFHTEFHVNENENLDIKSLNIINYEHFLFQKYDAIEDFYREIYNSSTVFSKCKLLYVATFSGAYITCHKQIITRSLSMPCNRVNIARVLDGVMLKLFNRSHLRYNRSELQKFIPFMRSNKNNFEWLEQEKMRATC